MHPQYCKLKGFFVNEEALAAGTKDMPWINQELLSPEYSWDYVDMYWGWTWQLRFIYMVTYDKWGR